MDKIALHIDNLRCRLTSLGEKEEADNLVKIANPFIFVAGGVARCFTNGACRTGARYIVNALTAHWVAEKGGHFVVDKMDHSKLLRCLEDNEINSDEDADVADNKLTPECKELMESVAHIAMIKYLARRLGRDISWEEMKTKIDWPTMGRERTVMVGIGRTKTSSLNKYKWNCQKSGGCSPEAFGESVDTYIIFKNFSDLRTIKSYDNTDDNWFGSSYINTAVSGPEMVQIGELAVELVLVDDWGSNSLYYVIAAGDLPAIIKELSKHMPSSSRQARRTLPDSQTAKEIAMEPCEDANSVEDWYRCQGMIQ